MTRLPDRLEASAEHGYTEGGGYEACGGSPDRVSSPRPTKPYF